MRILIIEDDKSLRNALRMILQIEGHEAQGVERGEEGLSLLHTQQLSHPFGMVLLDLNTDGISPLEFMKGLGLMKVIPGLSIPVVAVLSGSNVIEAETQRIGADFFIRKPFNHDELIAGVARAQVASGLLSPCSFRTLPEHSASSDVAAQ